jgi:integrase/recombinase XerD
MRIGELTQLTWTDIDFERKFVKITPEKGSNPRMLPLSDKLLKMIGQQPRNRKTIFQKDKDALREYFSIQRTKTAERLGNPRIKAITFHTFRHWKATMEYHKTKDIIHVQQMLGHKDIKSTMFYINLESALFLTTTDEWTCKVAHNETEAIQLIEANFAYVNNIGELAFYKKRK